MAPAKTSGGRSARESGTEMLALVPDRGKRNYSWSSPAGRHHRPWAPVSCSLEDVEISPAPTFTAMCQL